MQNYTFLFNHRLFRFLLGVFYEADPAVCYIFCDFGSYYATTKELCFCLSKKNPPRKELDGNLQSSILIFNYNSNNKVRVTLFSFEVMLAPSVNPVAKNP